MRTFTKAQLVDFIKSKMSYSQKASEELADLVFKARTKGSKDKNPRKKLTTGRDWGSLPKARAISRNEKKFWDKFRKEKQNK